MHRRIALAGALAALGIVGVTLAPVRLEPGTPGWRRLVRGAEHDGSIPRGAVVVLPGLARDAPARVRIALSVEGTGSVGTSVDGAPLVWSTLSRIHGGINLRLPPGPSGTRVELRVRPGSEVPRIASVTVFPPQRPRVIAMLLAFAFVAGLTAVLLRGRATGAVLAVGLFAAGLVVLARCPTLLFLALPAFGSSLAVGFPLALVAASAAVALRGDRAARRDYARAAALVAAFVFGAAVRGAFLASAGSWDTEYWKAWMLRAADHGVTRVYGDPGAVPPGRLLAQMSGEEELWKAEMGGRSFVVDYPPLAMMLWRWSWWAVGGASGLDPPEVRNVAVKLPAVLGDIAALAVLLWALGSRGLWAAAVYWAAPVSWLPGAALGYLDGAYAPLAAAALVCAGRGRSGWAGAWLAAACLVKPTAVVLAPAVAVALVPAGLGRAFLAGLGLVFATLAPFALAGTLGAAVVHVYRILFQGTLSGGFPNPWWILGHVVTVAGGAAAAGDPVPFVRLGAVPFPARTVGAVLFALAAAWIVWCQRRAHGPRAATLAGAALVFAYAMLAVGVHENHPHPMFLLLLCTGLPTRRLRVVAAGMSVVYVLGMLMLSGLGRFYGPRYAALEPAARALSTWRMALGFDLTLLLAVVATALFAWLLIALRAEMQAVTEPAPPPRG